MESDNDAEWAINPTGQVDKNNPSLFVSASLWKQDNKGEPTAKGSKFTGSLWRSVPVGGGHLQENITNSLKIL